jgi:hypothetical protein
MKPVVREIMVFLHSHGVGTARAVRIFKTYGATPLQKLKVRSKRRLRSSSPNMRLCRASILLERWPVKFEEVQDHLPVPAAVHSLHKAKSCLACSAVNNHPSAVDHRLGTFSS